MENKDLKAKYNEMHKQGSSAWFSDGREERELILKMGEPWQSKCVLEIGCGEGDLGFEIHKQIGVRYSGIDYSEQAIKKAKEKDPTMDVLCRDYRTCNITGPIFDRIVMQGVLEHLDDPFTELKWMMDNLLIEHGDMITSSPCFLNPRGIVWMTLDMVGAVMSKTDLHFLNPWQFFKFAASYDYKISAKTCDYSWGMAADMVSDLRQRIPLALRDGKINYEQKKLDHLLSWLANTALPGMGATAVYHIKKK